MTDNNFDDLFWVSPKRTELPPLKWRKVYGLPDIEKAEVEFPGDTWDELSHIQEQYNIKCDELKTAMMENRRLSLILIDNGLENLLEIDDGKENSYQEENEDS